MLKWFLIVNLILIFFSPINIDGNNLAKQISKNTYICKTKNNNKNSNLQAPPYDHSNKYYWFDSIDVKLFQPDNTIEIIPNFETDKKFGTNAPTPIELTYTINASGTKSLYQQFPYSSPQKKQLSIFIPTSLVTQNNNILSINLDLHFLFKWFDGEISRTDSRIYQGVFNLNNIFSSQNINLNNYLKQTSQKLNIPWEFSLCPKSSNYSVISSSYWIFSFEQNFNATEIALCNPLVQIQSSSDQEINNFTLKLNNLKLLINDQSVIEMDDLNIFSQDEIASINLSEPNYYNPLTDKVEIGNNSLFNLVKNGLALNPYILENNINFTFSLTVVSIFGFHINLNIDYISNQANFSSFFIFSQNEITNSYWTSDHEFYFNKEDLKQYGKGISYEEFENKFFKN